MIVLLKMYDYDNADKVHRGPPGIKWLEPTDSLEGHLNSTDPDFQVRKVKINLTRKKLANNMI